MNLANIYRNFKSNVIILGLGLILFIKLFSNHRWNQVDLNARAIYADVYAYYTYLPATFIHQDLKMKFYDEIAKDTSSEEVYWILPLENGNKITKMAMGWAILNTPAFLMAHAYAHFFNYKTNGFSTPYQFAISINLVLFVLFGLYLLFQCLQLYFNKSIASILLILITLATNLYYYTVITYPLAHGYNFFLIAAFIYLSIKWHKAHQQKDLLLLAIVAGLIVLMRPVNISIVLFFILFNVSSFKTIKDFFLYYKKFLKQGLLAALVFILVILPQLAYWKFVADHWVFYSYIGEHFYWNRALIIEFLFSYRKGWFIYTPIMFLAMLGFFVQQKKFQEISIPSLLIISIMIYINSCWWCWWFGGSFGSRPMVDFYALMAFPLGALLEHINKNYFPTKIMAMLVCILLVRINLFQSEQAKSNLIHWDSMTREAYWKVFMDKNYPADYEKYLNTPDYEAAKAGRIAR